MKYPNLNIGVLERFLALHPTGTEIDWSRTRTSLQDYARSFLDAYVELDGTDGLITWGAGGRALPEKAELRTA